MNQIALPLDISSSSKRGGYLIADCNAEVHTQLENWKLWPHKTAILIGPKSSGKTAMAEQFVKKTGGLILDDADQEAAETIFHLWNRAVTDQRPPFVNGGTTRHTMEYSSSGFAFPIGRFTIDNARSAR